VLVDHICYPATQEAEIQRSVQKYPMPNRASEVPQAVEHLPNKKEALNSSCSTTKKTKNE
jgi:hypothetical protein